MKLFKKYTTDDIPEGYDIFINGNGKYLIRTKLGEMVINPNMFVPRIYFNSFNKAVRYCIKYDKIEKQKANDHNWKNVRDT